MNLITLHPVSNPGSVLKACRPRVYVGGRRSDRLEVLSIDWQKAPEFGEARIAAVRAEDTTRPPRMEQLASLPAVGQAVRICEPLGRADWVFEGVVSAHEVTVDGDSERLTARLTHALASDLDGPVNSRLVWDAGEAVLERDARVVFNAGAGTWASARTVDVAGRAVRVFSSDNDAVRWSVADALAYLLAAHGRSIAVSVDAAAVAWAKDVDLGRLDVSGRAVREAVAAVAKRAGLFVRAARGGGGLVVQSIGRGRRGSVRLAPAGQRASAASSNLWKADIRIGRRPARRGVVVLGAAKRFEATFELSPGWDPYQTPATWNETVRSRRDDWAHRGDVLRRWVLNEDGAYAQAPWNLPVHDFGALSETDFTRPIPRRLEPCLSTDAQGRSLGVIVEVSVDDGATWRRWRGPIRVSAERADVLLDGDELSGDYYRAALVGEARVRVTATVASDARLTVEIDGDPGAGRQVVVEEGLGQWAAVSEASVLAGVDGLGRPLEVDDTARLEAIARRHVEMDSAVEATLTLGWCEPTWMVGDLVEQIDGRGLSLADAPGRVAQVTRLRHEFGDSQQTILTVR